MPRIRTIKPEFWRHEQLSALPESTHMLAAALLNYADDHGYFNANPRLIEAEIFPLRPPSVAVPQSLKALAAIGFIALAAAPDGRRYGRVVAFTRHQRVSHPTDSRIAALALDWDAGKIPDEARSVPERVRPEQGKEQGREAEGEREREKDSSSDPRADADLCDDDAPAPKRSANGRKTYPQAFADFWRDYPTDPIMSKIRAFEKWRGLNAQDRKAAHDALAPFRAHCAKNPTYRPVHAERFLSQRRFDGFAITPGPRDAAVRAMWNGAAEKLVAEIGAAAFQAYFGNATCDAGPPVTIRFNKLILRDLVQGKFTAALTRAFGTYVLEGPQSSAPGARPPLPVMARDCGPPSPGPNKNAEEKTPPPPIHHPTPHHTARESAT